MKAIITPKPDCAFWYKYLKGLQVDVEQCEEPSLLRVTSEPFASWKVSEEDDTEALVRHEDLSFLDDQLPKP